MSPFQSNQYEIEAFDFHTISLQRHSNMIADGYIQENTLATKMILRVNFFQSYRNNTDNGRPADLSPFRFNQYQIEALDFHAISFQCHGSMIMDENIHFTAFNTSLTR